MLSVWQAVPPPKRIPPLAQNLSVDVAIVGGGITGLLCAHELAITGASVAVLEARSIGGGSTGNSTGNLYAVVGERNDEIDDADAPAVLAARADAVDLIERLVQDLRIDCGFVRCPWTLYAESDEGRPKVERAAKLASLGGIAASNATPALPFPVVASTAIERQAQFNPWLFVQGLADRLLLRGVPIHERTRVASFDGARGVLHTEHGDVKCRFIVLATHSPKGRLLLHGEMGTFREYGIAAPLEKDVLPPGIHWNAEEPYRSIRSYRHDGKLHLVVVGESHRTGEREDTIACLRTLEAWAKARFAIGDVAYRWSAQNHRPADGLPFIGTGPFGDNVFVATGYAADGLTWAGVAARMIADAIGGRKHPLAERLDPARVSLGKELVSEAVNTLKQFARDLPGLGESVERIERGGGAVVDRHGEKIAVHRDMNGTLHAVSAVCTHMQCIVRWNTAERTWDCPCHGSRFDVDGSVIEGPALDDLPARDVPPA